MRILPKGLETLTTAIERVGRTSLADRWTGLEIMTRDSLLPHVDRVAFSKRNGSEGLGFLATMGASYPTPFMDDDVSSARWAEARGILHQHLADGDEAAAAFDSSGQTNIIRAVEWLSENAHVGLRSGTWPPNSSIGAGQILILKLDEGTQTPPVVAPPPGVSYKIAKATGTPTKIDWEGMMVELARLHLIEGTQNKRQGEIVVLMQKWFTGHGQEEPSSSEIRLRVKRFQSELQKADRADGNF